VYVYERLTPPVADGVRGVKKVLGG